MNEPKKRGRPPKVKAEAVTEPVINGDHSREPEDVLPVKAAPFAMFGDTVIQSDVLEKLVRPSAGIDPRAQAYALRVWNGQSRDVPRSERLKRVKAALEGQGLSMEGVEL